ncbi:MAG: FAD-dependent oxidoreductase [Erysipelotrichaceae bacterium]
MKKIIIVGGVAGGASAAARLRRLSEEDQIILFEKDEYISFANCGLPYYLGGVIQDHDRLLVQTVEGMSKRFALDIRNFSEVIKVDPQAKTLQVYDHRNQTTYEEDFDVIILSPGAKPLVPPFAGLQEATNWFTLRNIPDTDAIYAFMQTHQPKHATVVGGGFIGVEMAENLREKGLEVTLVEKMPQVLAPLDFEMAQLVHEELQLSGVKLRLNAGVDHFEQAGSQVVLDDGSRFETDMIILAIGVRPTTDLGKDTFALGPRGHFLVNNRLQLFTPNNEVLEHCYAIGDAIEVVDFVNQAKTAIPLAWPANRQGRIVADIINGDAITYEGTLGSSVLKVFDLTIATTGNNERTLKQKGIPYVALHAHRGNHAGYYPNAKNIALKILYHPDTKRILGAQGVGGEGTEKRIDVIATAIKLHASIESLSSLELCYAPPFSSAKDPVNILGYIAENLIQNRYRMFYAHEVDTLAQNKAFFLDVRTPIEFSTGHLPNAINIEVDALRERLAELPQERNTPIYVNCQVGQRAYLAIQILRSHGYQNLYNLSGGYTTYRASQFVSA